MFETKNVKASLADEDKQILKGMNLMICEREVLQSLPMEFAMEAQKLVAISLEGSVG